MIVTIYFVQGRAEMEVFVCSTPPPQKETKFYLESKFRKKANFYAIGVNITDICQSYVHNSLSTTNLVL